MIPVHTVCPLEQRTQRLIQTPRNRKSSSELWKVFSLYQFFHKERISYCHWCSLCCVLNEWCFCCTATLGHRGGSFNAYWSTQSHLEIEPKYEINIRNFLFNTYHFGSMNVSCSAAIIREWRFDSACSATRGFSSHSILRLVHFLWLAVLPHDNCSEGPDTEQQDYCCNARHNHRVLSRKKVLVQYVISVHERLEKDQIAHHSCHFQSFL